MYSVPRFFVFVSKMKKNLPTVFEFVYEITAFPFNIYFFIEIQFNHSCHTLQIKLTNVMGVL
jgi:hypothetical protein